MKPSESKISLSLESYDEKTAENYRNCYVAEECIGFKLWKISIKKILLAQIGDFNRYCINISLPYILYSLRNKPSKSVSVGSGRFIFLNDLASPKRVIKIYYDI